MKWYDSNRNNIDWLSLIFFLGLVVALSGLAIFHWVILGFGLSMMLGVALGVSSIKPKLKCRKVR